MSETNDSPQLLTVPTVARHLSVSERTVWRYFKAGHLTPIRISDKCTRVSVDNLNSFIEGRIAA